MASTLTKKETEVLKLIALGNQSKDICKTLNITINTLETHTRSIRNKYKVRKSAGAVYLAAKSGII